MNNRELYAAYREQHNGDMTDPYTTYWPFMSEEAKDWYLAHRQPADGGSIEQALTKLLVEQIDKLFSERR